VNSDKKGKEKELWRSANGTIRRGETKVKIWTKKREDGL